MSRSDRRVSQTDIEDPLASLLHLSRRCGQWLDTEKLHLHSGKEVVAIADHPFETGTK